MTRRTVTTSSNSPWSYGYTIRNNCFMRSGESGQVLGPSRTQILDLRKARSLVYLGSIQTGIDQSLQKRPDRKREILIFRDQVYLGMIRGPLFLYVGKSPAGYNRAWYHPVIRARRLSVAMLITSSIMVWLYAYSLWFRFLVDYSSSQGTLGYLFFGRAVANGVGAQKYSHMIIQPLRW